jgi:ectoine hydroxylase-related dioxygenase (phytanoyl-CoA dioxygenase family)
MKYEPEEWRRACAEDGFVVVRELLDARTLSDLRERLEGIVSNLDGLEPRLREKIFLESQHVRNNPQWYAGRLTPEECGACVRQIDDLPLFDPAFAELICHAPLLDVLEALFGSAEFTFNYLHGRPKAARFGNGISDGNFHRDTPFEDFTAVNTILAVLCLDDMTDDNGATAFVRGSHKVSDEEAKKPLWREVDARREDLGEKVTVRCPAGSALFFDTKTLHAAGHNRSARPRYTLLAEWVGPGVLPTSAERHAFQGLKPRSKEPAFEKQLRMTFPKLFGPAAH